MLPFQVSSSIRIFHTSFTHRHTYRRLIFEDSEGMIKPKTEADIIHIISL
jgi:hypothetical protein